jgi:hypothetical protein
VTLVQALPVVDGGTLPPALEAPERFRALEPPAPRRPADDDGFGPETTLARMALSRARMRAVIPMDVVTFVAPCPACGGTCEWTQERQETRVRSRTNCPCTP